MTDKEKFRKEVEKLKSQLLRGACSSQVAMETRCKEEAYNEVLAILDTMQEESVSGLDNGDMPIERWKQAVKAASNQRNYRSSKGLTETRDDYFVDGVQWADEHPKKEHVSEEWIEELRTKLDSMSKEEFRTVWEKIRSRVRSRGKEEPVSEDLEKAEKEWLTPQLDKSYADYGETKMMELTHFDGYAMLDAIEFGAKWQKTKDESTTEDLGEYIDELSKQFPEVSFAKLSRIAVRVSRWQRNQDAKNKLPKVINRTDLDEFAYQCAYDLSNDWAIDNPTWHDVEDACKLGAKWQKEQDQSTIELAEDHAMLAGMEKAKEQMMKEPNLSGYVARDEDGNLHVFEVEPRRLEEKHRWWDRDYNCHIIDKDAFPDLRWKDEPICVKLIIIKED